MQYFYINRKNVWIRGCAGTGKSTLLLYVARLILAQTPSPSVLLVVYTKSLVEMFKTAFRELSKIYNIQFRIPIVTIYNFMSSPRYYDYILCDEVQDMTERMLIQMRQCCSRIIVSGDIEQSIYDYDPKWNEKTVNGNQIIRLIHGAYHELKTNKRLSQSIINAVKTFAPLKTTAQINLARSETQISIYKSNLLDSEISYVSNQALRSVDNEYTTAILLPSQAKMENFVNRYLYTQNLEMWRHRNNQWGRTDFGDMNDYLHSLGIKMQYIGNGYGEFYDNAEYVVLSTYHSAKGLDFDYVFLPFCNGDMWLSYNEEISKTLFMVAMTRARLNLNISYTGRPHAYVNSFENNCRVRTI